MQIPDKITCVGFLLAISTLTASIPAHATPKSSNSSIESRLSRLTEAMKQRGMDSFDENLGNNLLAGGWADGRRGDWVNTHRGGFADRHGGGGFVNRNWGDGGRFYNHSGGGGFANRTGGGGFWNR